MSPFGRAMSPLQNDYNYLENLKKTPFRKKKVVLSEKLFFRAKRQNFSTILKMQVYNLNRYL